MSYEIDEKQQRDVYVDFLSGILDEGKSVILEADLSSSIGTNKLIDKYGKRYINVGIMEQQMIGLASGLSVMGFKPFIHTFVPFASRRVFDQVFLALNYNESNAVLIGSDAGVAATANGGTHMGLEDMALMRSIPKATIFEPSDNLVFKEILKLSNSYEGFTYIRTIRKNPYKIHDKVDVKKGYSVVREGTDVLIIASGIMVKEALESASELAVQGVSVKVIDLFRIKPINPDILDELVDHKFIVTAENHNVIGGVGSAVTELFSENKPTMVKRIGVRETFGEVGSEQYLQERFSINSKSITEIILK